MLELCLEPSCAPEAAGGTARRGGGHPPFDLEVDSTGGWDDFEVRRAPTVELATGGSGASGDQRRIEGPLMKLRSVEFRPVTR